MRTVNAEELRAEIERLGPWHEDLEIAPGVRTGERKPRLDDPTGVAPARCGLVPAAKAMEVIARALFPDGQFAGRSVLDCACNAGGYLLEAKRRGAGRCFGFDVREHWIEQARFLARHLPSEGVEFAQCSLEDLPARQLEPFDVTLFLGIFYHLPDPVAGLKIAADLTRELLIFDTDARTDYPGDALVLNMESDTHFMSGIHGLAWVPSSVRVLEQILRWCGFPHTRHHYTIEYGVKSLEQRRRIQIFAARDERSFAYYDATHPRPTPPLWRRVARGVRRRLLPFSR
jgi:tRNA (mo5U34)-methyltransferase